MRAGTFAVGTCDMNAFELAMRMSEMLVKRFGGLQTWLVSLGTYLFKNRSAIEQIFYGFLIIHCFSAFITPYYIYKGATLPLPDRIAPLIFINIFSFI